MSSGGPSRHVKSRSGCEPCKRRRVKCDEAYPQCQRCQKRNETCTGNFRPETFQVVRPWLYSAKPMQLLSACFSSLSPNEDRIVRTHAFTHAPENELLRHWVDHACLTMAIMPPPLNPLASPFSPYLRRSRAVRHAIQCISQAHIDHFSTARITAALEERSLALVSLQREIDRAGEQDGSALSFHLRAILFASLLLGISSGWLGGDESWLSYLFGTRKVVAIIVQQNDEAVYRDEIFQYLLGLYVYWEALSSYITPSFDWTTIHDPPSPIFLATVAEKYLQNTIHPVTGICSSLFPLLAELGQYYRRVVDALELDLILDQLFETRLIEWSPRAMEMKYQSHYEWQFLWYLADAYRAIGFIMLYQARSVVRDLTGPELGELYRSIEVVMTTLEKIPSESPLVNSAGPFLVIAGSELRETDTAWRDLVTQHVAKITVFTRIGAYSSAFTLVQEVWRRRSAGSRITWMELMVEQGITLFLA